MRFTIKTCWLAVLFLCSEVGASDDLIISEKPLLVTIFELLANRDAFDGKHIQISGYACYQSGSSGLFLSRQDCLDNNYLSAISLSNVVLEEVGFANGQVATFKGVFHSRKDVVVLGSPYQQGDLMVFTYMFF